MTRSLTEVDRILLMLDALRHEVRAATYAVRGTHKWDHDETQPKLLRRFDKADALALRAIVGVGIDKSG